MKSCLFKNSAAVTATGRWHEKTSW